jgi:aminomethyltransferase
MKSVRDRGLYPRIHDPDLRSPLMQAGLVWSTLDSTELPPRLDGHTLRYNDPGDVLGLLAATVGPPTGVCILEDTVVGAAGWAGLPLQLQYEAVTTRAVAFVAGAMNYLRVSGPDAARLLGMLTPKDISRLPVRRATFALFTTPAGTVDNEAVVLRVAEDEYLLSCGGPTKAPSWLPEARKAFPHAQVEDAGVACFNIKGPRRMEAMARLVHPDDRGALADLRQFEARHLRTPRGVPAWVLRTTIGVEMWGDGDAMRESWFGILAMPELVTPGSWDLLDVYRLECTDMVFGVYPIDLHGATTLWETGFGWMVDPPKPTDYVGKAALLASKDTPRLWLAGLAARDSSTGVPSMGQEVFTPDGEFAGYVTTAAYSPRYGRPLAFAHLKPSCPPGGPLVVEGVPWVATTVPMKDVDALVAANGTAAGNGLGKANGNGHRDIAAVGSPA